MDIVNKIISFENGELNRNEVIEFFRELYLTDSLSGLQGTYQRTFNSLVQNGLISIDELKRLKTLKKI